MPTRRIADPFAKKIGARIRDLRLDRGKSLAALAEASDVSTGHLSTIERGYVLMNVGTLGRIAKGLGVGMGELFTGVEGAQQ
ncbi:MAG TPA: helix-turn-helix transcriptional regulator [Polyangium sp.]|nr:helix-turn-helix transcriptional regulator [Polyangium sp.]